LCNLIRPSPLESVIVKSTSEVCLENALKCVRVVKIVTYV